VQAEFVHRGKATIARWKQEGGGRSVDEAMAGLQERLPTPNGERLNAPADDDPLQGHAARWSSC